MQDDSISAQQGQYLFTMSSALHDEKKHADEKVIPNYVDEVDYDGSNSIDTLTALIVEGENLFHSTCNV